MRIQRPARLIGILVLIFVMALGIGIWAAPHWRGKPAATPPATEAPVPEASPTPQAGDLPEPTPEPTPPGPTLPPTETLSLLAVGDIMLHKGQTESALVSGDTYDFTSVFTEVKPYIEAADIAFANFETVTAGKSNGGYGFYPTFNSPYGILDALKLTGFDVLTHANNHTMDRGMAGVIGTRNYMQELGFLYTGSNTSYQEQDQILMVSAKGIRIAVLAYTEMVNSFGMLETAAQKEYATNLMNKARMLNDIKRARQQGADIVIMCLHWGDEYDRNAPQRNRALARELIAAGVDIIFGSHPHVVQTIERLHVDGDLGPREGIVYYSLGNFISGMYKQYRDDGLMAQVTLIRDTASGTVKLGECSYLSVWHEKTTGAPTPNGYAYKLHVCGTALFENANLTSTQRDTMKRIWQDTLALIGDNNATPIPCIPDYHAALKGTSLR
nr:CapA family protein [bacterium]